MEWLDPAVICKEKLIYRSAVSFVSQTTVPDHCKPGVTYIMMTSSNGNIFRVTGHSCGDFTGDQWNSPHKGQWRAAFMFSLIYAWINGWVNNDEAGDLRRHRAHDDVIVICQFCRHWWYMKLSLWQLTVPTLTYNDDSRFSITLCMLIAQEHMKSTYILYRYPLEWHIKLKLFVMKDLCLRIFHSPSSLHLMTHISRKVIMA